MASTSPSHTRYARAEPPRARISAETRSGTPTTSVTMSVPRHVEATKALSRYRPSMSNPPADTTAARTAIRMVRIEPGFETTRCMFA
jgi:hypothetical protein